MTTQTNKIIVDELIERLRIVNQDLDREDTKYSTLLTQRDKVRADLEVNDATRLALAEKRDAITDHIALLSPPLSDEEIAVLENTPDVIE